MTVKVPRWSQRRRILIVLGLNLVLIVGLIVAGIFAHSVSVLAAAGDTVADCFALMLGLVAIALRTMTRTIRTHNDRSPSRRS